MRSCGTFMFKLRKYFMPSTEDIIQEAAALPVEERIIVVDSLLRTLNIPKPDIDTEWAAVAKTSACRTPVRTCQAHSR